MPITAVIGGHWGDEGKGKVIDYFVQRGYDAVARYNGACNAGHTVYPNGRKVALHVIPSGIFHEGVKNIIGNGVAIDPERFLEETRDVEAAGGYLSNLLISDRCKVTTPYHLEAERQSPKARRIGTTSRGVGPTFSSHTARIAPLMRDFFGPADYLTEMLRELDVELGVSDKLVQSGFDPINAPVVAELYKRILGNFESNVTDTVYMLNEMLSRGERIIAEGAQGTLLDIDHGTYPDVTSSNAFAGGVSRGLGVPPKSLAETVGVMKAGYITRVGGGSFPTELGTEATLAEERELNKKTGKLKTSDPQFFELKRRVETGAADGREIGYYLRLIGNEEGASTGRVRRTGWPDMVATKYSNMVNGFDWIALTKLDVTDFVPRIQVCTAYEIDGNRTERFVPFNLDRCSPVYDLVLEGWMSDTSEARDFDDLPRNAQKLIGLWETVAPVRLISNGPERYQTIFR